MDHFRDRGGGNVDLGGGKVDPGGGNVDPSRGNVDPGGGNVDPIGAVFANIYHDGYSHNWHFDESHWSTTVLLQVLATPC